MSWSRKDWYCTLSVKSFGRTPLSLGVAFFVMGTSGFSSSSDSDEEEGGVGVWCGRFGRPVAFPFPFLSGVLGSNGLSEGSGSGSDPGSGVGGFLGVLVPVPCCCVDIDIDCS